MVVTFRPTISNTMTRAIGDGSKINELVVGVYSGEELIFTQEMQWNKAQSDGVNLTLIEGRSYKILFWAHHRDNNDNSAYEVTKNGITVNYDKYLNGGFAKMEELDAFCATATVTVGSQKIEDKGDIPLSRPLAQVNFADDTTSPTPGSHKAVVTFTQVPTAFNPFTGKVTMSDASLSEDKRTFTFTDFPTEPLMVDGATYYYVTDNYFFAPASIGPPASIGATLNLQNADGTLIKTVKLEDDDIALEANKKTNVLGSIVQQPETWSVWDGVSESQPTTDAQNRYIIDDAADIAWLCENDLDPNSYFLQTNNIDMASKAIASIKLPAGSTYDGGGKAIKNYKNSLFGDATAITVKDLNADSITASGTTHVGVLVNTLKGSSSFTNVTITNSSATTTNGAAGGMIGYIVRKSEKDRTETLSVSFIGCKLNGVSVSGSTSEGKFVGLLSGYDNHESLSFDTACEATDVTVADYDSMYAEGNEATWLADKDYTNFNGWLGNETYHRGTIYYGASNRFVPCWDGSTTITPLTDGSVKLIYSAFDLANLQGTAAGNIKLMEDVDMEHDLDGASKDGVRNHIFMALSTLTKLDGNGKTIYNITIRDNYYGGFVKSESCATTFENVTFDGADIRVTHDTAEGNAYVGTLRGFAYASTTINNVHVRNGYLNGVCKIGGLCGGIFSKITCSNSSVSNYSIENYDSQIISAGFKANGEIGGLIGYITVLDANTVNEISNCTVSDNNFNCVTYSASLWDRSVAPFIGDIRTQQAGTVRINNCKILGTNTYTNASDGKTATFDQHRKQTGGSWLRPTYTYYPLVGQCYNVLLIDKKGKVYIDNTQIN